MANITDAFGTIVVREVGKEFIDFLEKVQSDAYYLLVDPTDYEGAEVDENGDLQFEFCTGGRWNYGNNMQGYLGGEWMKERDPKTKKAYDKFIEALLLKNGSVNIEYSDSDSAMDWMGKGVATLQNVDGVARLSDDFESRDITIEAFAEMNGESETWALDYLKGDDVGEEYSKYVKECETNKVNPVSASDWYDTIYEEV